mgnify:CR=1|jgi:hypothetical protein
MDFSVLQISFFITTYVSVSLWEVVTFQRNTTAYPYAQGFAVFSLIQWLAIAIGMIAIFGWVYGLIILVICITVLQYLCHFTLGPLINMTISINYLFPTALFAVTIWVLLALGVIQAVF